MLTASLSPKHSSDTGFLLNRSIHIIAATSMVLPTARVLLLSFLACSKSNASFHRSSSAAFRSPSKNHTHNNSNHHFPNNLGNPQHYHSSKTIMFLSKMHSPPADRNKDPIWKVLQAHVFSQHLQTTTTPSNNNDSWNILEVAGGAGVHTVHFVTQLAKEYPNQSFHWQSTDAEEPYRASQVVYFEEDLASELLERHVAKTPLPLTLNEHGIIEDDTRKAILPDSIDVILNINMIHISPWEATVGLMKLARESLKEGGILYLYGPYKRNGTAAASNLKFDGFLKAKDARFGLRNLEDVTALAEREGLQVLEVMEMPANNLSVILRKAKR